MMSTTEKRIELARLMQTLEGLKPKDAEHKYAINIALAACRNCLIHMTSNPTLADIELEYLKKRTEALSRK